MIPTGAPSTRAQAPSLTRLLLCLATLTALIAMHGPSTDHNLVMPAAATTAEPMSAMAAPAQTPKAAASQPTRACVDSSSMADMSHAQCLATPRPSSPLPGLAVLAVVTQAHQHKPRACVAHPVPARSPPRPSLDKLCISRT